MWRKCCPPSGAGDKKPIPRIGVVPPRRYGEPAASTDPEANRQLTARRLPQTRLRRASSLPEGAMGAYHFTLDFRNSMVPSVESLRQKSKIFASSLSQGSLGCSADTGRVREVTIRRKPPCALSAATRRSFLSQGSLWVRYRYRAGQGSNESQKVAVRIVSGDSPQLPPGGSYGRVGFLEACAWNGKNISRFFDWKKGGKIPVFGFFLLLLIFRGLCFAIFSRWAQNPQRRACTGGR